MPSIATPSTPRSGTTLQSLLRWSTWPLALSIACAAAWLLSRDPRQAVPLQMATMLAAVLLAVLAARVVPLRSDWQRGSRAEVRTDLTSMAVLMMAADPIVKRGLLPLVATVGVPLVAPDGGFGWFPTQWHLVLQLVFAAAIAECGQYAVHRAMHAVRWMWGLHGFHHNPTRIHWLNAFRAHPLNMVLHQFAGLHRWHHATAHERSPVDFGGLLTLWDLVFGTDRRAGGMPTAVGVDAGAPRAVGYVAALREAMHEARRQPCA